MSVLGKIVGQLESGGSSSGVLAQSKVFQFYNPAPPYYIILCKLEDGAYCKGGVHYYCHLNFDVFIKSTPDGDNNIFTAFGIATSQNSGSINTITNVSAVKLTYNGVEYAALKVEGSTDHTNYNFVFAEGSHPDVFQVVRGSAGATEDSGWLVFRNAVDFIDCTPEEST